MRFFIGIFIMFLLSFTPLLMLAIKGSFLEALEEEDIQSISTYISLGANPDVALKYAILTDNMDILKTAVKSGANVNLRIDHDGNTALMLAARNGHSEMVQFLIDQGANVMAKNNCGKTAIDMSDDRIKKIIIDRSLVKYIAQ